jgi:hypothetical protein
MKNLTIACLFILFFSVIALTQSHTGRLVGTVAGPDGLIPGASVVVVDNKTGLERTVTTGDEGTFAIPQLEFGTYTVKVTAPGFMSYNATDLKIDVGREYSLNVKLEIGNITETVTVTAGAEVVNATTGELSETISNSQIQALPLEGRNPLNLVLLQPGTASNGAQNVSVNGQRSSFTNITRDGMNVQDPFIRENAVTFTSERGRTDDVEEFTITTQNAGADKGSGSSHLQMVTPRGQSDFHGALYEYNRNSKFSANTFFSNMIGEPKSFLNRNQFGGKLGGPLWLPRFGEGGPAIIKDKAFFFFRYEGERLREGYETGRTILRPAARQGLFTYSDLQGNLNRVNLLQMAGLSGIDPVVQSRILANIPTQGNFDRGGDGLNTVGYRINQAFKYNRDGVKGRIDYDISSRHAVNGVFILEEEKVTRPDYDDGGFGKNPVVFNTGNHRSITLAYRMTPGPTFTNELRGGYSVSSPKFDRNEPIPPYFLDSALISMPEVSYMPQGRDTEYFNLQNNAEKRIGNHSIRFGGQAHFYRVDPYESFGVVPTYTLATNPSTIAFTANNFPGGITNNQLATANSLLALLGGFVSTGSQTFNVTSKTSGYIPGAGNRQLFSYENIAGYVEDQWRIRPNLTLNLGLRYEMFTPVRDRRGLALEPVIPEGVDPVTAVLNPNGTFGFVGGNAGGTKYHKLDKNNFAPVLSFAYSPMARNGLLNRLGFDGKTVIRGAFRMSYVNDEFLSSADTALGVNEGLKAISEALNPATGTPFLNQRLSEGLPEIPVPPFTGPRTFLENNILSNGLGAIYGIHPEIQTPRLTEYSFGIQREIGFKTAIEIRYAGWRSNNLIRGADYNQVDIRNNGFLEDFMRARSNLLLTGNAACNQPGCQALTVFPRLAGGGFVNNPQVQNMLFAGTPADLAFLYIRTQTQGGVRFFENPNASLAALLNNNGKARYDSLQTLVRRRFSRGLEFGGNYTFQKVLTNTVGTSQLRFEPFLDLENPQLEYARADYDQTHVFNFYSILDLPFGEGRWLFNNGGFLNHIVGGWQFSTSVRLGTGAPITISDPRGTLNRASRAGRQTATTNLTKEEIKSLIGVHRTEDGVYYIDPSVMNPDTGRAAEGYGFNFPGQKFFNVAPGQTGNMERMFINGPIYFNVDTALRKTIGLTETVKLELNAEAFNVLNRANFAVTSGQQFSLFNINSSSFGQITTTWSPRILQFGARVEF